MDLIVCKSTKFPLFIQKIYHLFAFIMLKNVEKVEKNNDDCKIFQKKSVILHDK